MICRNWYEVLTHYVCSGNAVTSLQYSRLRNIFFKTIFKLLLEDSKAHVNLKKNVKISSEQANKLIKANMIAKVKSNTKGQCTTLRTVQVSVSL